MKKAKVAILKTGPATVLEDYARLLDLAGAKQASWPRGRRPPSSRTTSPGTIPFPRANTTPWQLEGTILALRRHGFNDLAASRTRRWSPTPSRART